MKLKYIVLITALINTFVISLNGIQDCDKTANSAIQESLKNKAQNWASDFFTGLKNGVLDFFYHDNTQIIQKIKTLKERDTHLFWFLGKLFTQKELEEEMKKYTVKTQPLKVEVDQALFDRFNPTAKMSETQSINLPNDEISKNMVPKPFVNLENISNFFLEAVKNPFIWAAIGLMIFCGYKLYRQEKAKKEDTANKDEESACVKTSADEDEFVEIMLSEDIDF